jgi:glyceraldehyde 3-phosphate dehydrogenase
LRVAINGFGRIGRMVFKASLKNPRVNVVAVNDLGDINLMAHLLKYDSVQPFKFKKVRVKGNTIIADGHKIKVFSEKDPTKLPWKRLKIHTVCESTGFFRTRELASQHIVAGAKKVLISAPAKGDQPVKTIVMGVNHKDITKKDVILSNASCTTNCLAPMVKVLNDAFKIKKGFFTTAHAYTSTQNLIDGPHKDWRRARAAAVNMIPTTTGASEAVGLVIPEMKGKLNGKALRVPLAVGSLTDFTVTLSKKPTIRQVNNAFKKASKKMKVLEYSEDELVSSDIVGCSCSVIFDSKLTMVNGNMVTVFGWYDSEWGYSTRMIDLMSKMK